MDVALGLTQIGSTPSRGMIRGGVEPDCVLLDKNSLEAFGRRRRAATWPHWQRYGLAVPMLGLASAILDACRKADAIHFNLDGLNLREAWGSGQAEGPYDAGVTNWEFVHTLRDSELRAKTIYWQNNRVVPLDRVLARAGATI